MQSPPEEVAYPIHRQRCLEGRSAFLFISRRGTAVVGVLAGFERPRALDVPIRGDRIAAVVPPGALDTAGAEMRDIMGRIRPGFLAGLAIIDRDPLASVEDLQAARVDETRIGWAKLYDRAASI